MHLPQQARRAREAALWKCPDCGRAFANRNQSHACAPLDLQHHFRGRDPAVLGLYRAFLKVLRGIGPVTVLAEKTRIAFQARISFAQLAPRRHHLSGHLLLARVARSAKFHRIDSLSPRNHVHHFRLESAQFLDREFAALLRAAYAVGNQEHLRSVRPGSPRRTRTRVRAR